MQGPIDRTQAWISKSSATLGAVTDGESVTAQQSCGGQFGIYSPGISI
jgi:hypothetical protein